MSLRITVLGSGTVVPSNGRRATALLVEGGGERLLFDCGPCVLEALEDAGTTFRSIDRVFVTHFHPDHTLGIGHLLAAINNDRTGIGDRELPLYGPDDLPVFMERLDTIYPALVSECGCLRLVVVSGGDRPVGGEVSVVAGQADHGGRSALSYRVEHAGASMVYTGDTAYSERVAELARGADLLVTECSFPDDQAVDGHLTPSGAGRLASRAGVKEVLLVHMYPLFGRTDPAALVRKHFDGAVTVARDGMTIDL